MARGHPPALFLRCAIDYSIFEKSFRIPGFEMFSPLVDLYRATLNRVTLFNVDLRCTY